MGARDHGCAGAAELEREHKHARAPEAVVFRLAAAAPAWVEDRRGEASIVSVVEIGEVKQAVVGVVCIVGVVSVVSVASVASILSTVSIVRVVGVVR